MKDKLTFAGIIMLIFLVIPVYGATETCFQEQVNSDPNGCGGLADTYASSDNYIYMTYERPADATSAIWQVKHGSFSTYNISLPAECFTASSLLELRIYTSFYGYTSTSESQPQCKNLAGNWIDVGTFSSSSGGGFGTRSASVTNAYDSNYETGIIWDESSNNFKSCSSGYCQSAMIFEEGIYWNLEGALQCTHNFDCSSNEACLSNQCVSVPAKNVSLSLGSLSFFTQEEVSGEMNISFTSELESALDDCIPDDQGYCEFYLNYEFYKPGYLTIFDPIISYSLQETSICDDGIDNDNDGFLDLSDPDCVNSTREDTWNPGNTKCSDGIDNDGNGQTDLLDPSCSSLEGNFEGQLYSNFTLSIISGQQFVSFPILPADKSIDSVFGDTIQYVQSIQTIVNGTLQQWTPDSPNIKSVVEGVGYAITSNATFDLILRGSEKTCIYLITKGYNYLGPIGLNPVSSEVFINESLFFVNSSGLIPISEGIEFSLGEGFVVYADAKRSVYCEPIGGGSFGNPS